MNLRCAFCQTPYAIGRTEMLAALQMLDQENLSHYDAHCPRCRRATQVPRQKLEMAFPNWREALKEAVSQASAAQQAAPAAAAPTDAGEKAAATPARKATPAASAKSTSSAKPGARAKPAKGKSPAKPAAKKTASSKTSKK